MRDVVVILLTLGFFALCIAYVALCDRVVGADDPDTGPEPDGETVATAVATEVAR
jgi:hypothetical protein